MKPTWYLGIDIQTRCACPYAVLDPRGQSMGSGWLDSCSPDDQAAFRELLRELSREANVFVGIDAPRQALREPREWYWERSKGWRRRRPSDKGMGRHCEVAVAALGLANPQWTPMHEDSPGWMKLGFALFGTGPRSRPFFEVFPSASYAQFTRGSFRMTVDLSGMAAGPKDMLDAYVAAATVREFVQGRGGCVGGGDGLGTIILPRPVSMDSAVLRWPVAQN